MPTPRVLLIDDDEDYAHFVERLLTRLGHVRPVTVVHDEAAALQALEGCTFDIVVSDYELQPGNGLEVLERVRDRCPGTLRILLTSAPERARPHLDGQGPPVAHAVWSKHWSRDTIQAELNRLTRPDA